MSEERQPDETCRVAVEGGAVAVYSYGTGERVLLVLHGGPGLPCDYVRGSHSMMAGRGWGGGGVGPARCGGCARAGPATTCGTAIR